MCTVKSLTRSFKASWRLSRSRDHIPCDGFGFIIFFATVKRPFVCVGHWGPLPQGQARSREQGNSWYVLGQGRCASQNPAVHLPRGALTHTDGSPVLWQQCWPLYPILHARPTRSIRLALPKARNPAALARPPAAPHNGSPGEPPAHGHPIRADPGANLAAMVSPP